MEGFPHKLTPLIRLETLTDNKTSPTMAHFVTCCGLIQRTTGRMGSTLHLEGLVTVGETMWVTSSFIVTIWKWFAVRINWWWRVTPTLIKKSVWQCLVPLTTAIGAVTRLQHCRLVITCSITTRSTTHLQNKRKASLLVEYLTISCDLNINSLLPHSK